MSARKGPALTVRASCYGCPLLDLLTMKWQNCKHPSAPPVPHYIECGTNTPAWCPELRAARLALGRELVGEEHAE